MRTRDYDEDFEDFDDAEGVPAVPPPPPSSPLTPQLTDEQQDAILWLVDQIEAGADVIACTGYAGTGKTTIIGPLRAKLHERGKGSLLGSPTHRAAMVLRSKGQHDADTVHAHALTPYFDADYRRAAAWMGEDLPARPGDVSEPRPDVAGMPWLIHDTVAPDLQSALDMQRKIVWSAQRRLESLGIRSEPHIVGQGPKDVDRSLILIVDEASMVGNDMLEVCQEACPQIILVGDPGQLAPVDDMMVLHEVPNFQLKHIHRQVADSPILHLAARARAGERFWDMRTLSRIAEASGGAIQLANHADAAIFLHAPLIVYRNSWRESCNLAIRQALGYDDYVLTPGEPLICRTTHKADRAKGFFNNGQFRVIASDPTDPRLVTLQNELGDPPQTVPIYLEELDGPRPPLGSIRFRLGYALTCHTAQGGEWPTGYIAWPEMNWYSNWQRSQRELPNGGLDKSKRWNYTAVTRAKTTLTFLTSYAFDTTTGDTIMAELDKDKKPTSRRIPGPGRLAPPSAPMLTDDPFAEPAPTAPIASPIPMVDDEPDEPDDIPDPEVPADLVEAILTDPIAPKTAENALGATQAETSPMVPVEPQSGSLRPEWRQFEPILQGLLGYVGNKLADEQARVFAETITRYREFDNAISATWELLKRLVNQAGEANEHALYSLAESLRLLSQQGMQLRHDPYTATVKAFTPQGFPVEITLRKSEPEELITSLPFLAQWMAENGYKPVID